MTRLLAGIVVAIMSLACQAPVERQQPETRSDLRTAVDANMSESCIAADLKVQFEEVRMNFLFPTEQPQLTLQLCREVPAEPRMENVIVVSVKRTTELGEVEDMYVGRMKNLPNEGWTLADSDVQIVYTNMVIKPAMSSSTEPEAVHNR